METPALFDGQFWPSHGTPIATHVGMTNANAQLIARCTLARRIARRPGVSRHVLQLVWARTIGYADLASDEDRAAYYDAAAYVSGVRDARFPR